MSLNDKLWGWLNRKPEGDFTTDLSLCFKWLVPKLTDAQRARLPGEFFHDGSFTFNGFWDNPALALCLAIEKLIDGEK